MSNTYMETRLYTRMEHSNIGENGDARLVIMKMQGDDMKGDYIIFICRVGVRT